MTSLIARQTLNLVHWDGHGLVARLSGTERPAVVLCNDKIETKHFGQSVLTVERCRIPLQDRKARRGELSIGDVHNLAKHTALVRPVRLRCHVLPIPCLGAEPGTKCYSRGREPCTG